MTPKYRSRIAEEVHEMAQGLHALGAIDTTEMQEFDVRCLAPALIYPFEIVRNKYCHGLGLYPHALVRQKTACMKKIMPTHLQYGSNGVILKRKGSEVRLTP